MAKAYCLKDGHIVVSNEAPLYQAIAFLEGKSHELNQLLNVTAETDFNGIRRVPNMPKNGRDRNIVKLEEFAKRLGTALPFYKEVAQFKSVEVLL